MKKAAQLSDYERADLKLGGGGQANVYRHYDVRSAKWYAVKVLRKDETSDLGREWQIRELVQTMKNDNHPRLLRAVTYHEFHDGFALVMPYYQLGSLSTQKACERFNMSQKKEAIRQVLHGLCHLHGMIWKRRDGVPQNIHRDIKPQNILVSLSNPISFCGTDGYRAPEVYNNLQEHEYTSAVDIYSLGMLLLWLLGLDPARLPAHFPDKNHHTIRVASKIDAAIDKSCSEDERNALRAARIMTQWEPESRYSAVECLQLPWLASPAPAEKRPQPPQLAPPIRRSSRLSGQAKTSGGRIQKSKAKVTPNINPRINSPPVKAEDPSSDVSMKDVSGPMSDFEKESGKHLSDLLKRVLAREEVLTHCPEPVTYDI